VGRGLDKFLLVGPLAAGAAWIAFSNPHLGDWDTDAAPAVSALAGGHVSTYLSAHPVMGPLATLAQAPFAALGSSQLTEYQWACIPSLLAAVALGFYLATIARRRGVSLATQALIAVLTLLNPLTICAVQAGHPEEVLTAALAIGAVAVAIQGHGGRAGLLLGLAIASKQWAVIAVLPTLLVLPRGKLRSGAIGLGTVAALYLPSLIASPGSFMDVQGNAASGGSVATIWSVWYPFANVDVVHLSGGLTGHVHRVPAGLGALTHPLILATALLLPLAVCLRRGRFVLSGEQAIALLTLLAVLRCILDPVNNIYYAVPLLLALVAWDALGRDRLPLRSLSAVAVSLLFWKWSLHLGDLHLFNFAYLAVLIAAGLASGATLLRRDRDPASAHAVTAVLELQVGDLPVGIRNRE
jgi:hypothetical protein